MYYIHPMNAKYRIVTHRSEQQFCPKTGVSLPRTIYHFIYREEDIVAIVYDGATPDARHLAELAIETWNHHAPDQGSEGAPE